MTQAYAADFPDEVSRARAGGHRGARAAHRRRGHRCRRSPGQEGGRVVDNAKALSAELADLDLSDVPVVALSQDVDEPWMAGLVASATTGSRVPRRMACTRSATGSWLYRRMHEDVPRLVLRAVEAAWAAASTGAGLPACADAFRGQKVRCRV